MSMRSSLTNKRTAGRKATLAAIQSPVMQLMEPRLLLAAGPLLSIDSVTQPEGDAGTSTFIFTVTLDQGGTDPVTVDYTVNDGTATTADSDYVAVAPGTLTFAPGETTQTISITVNGDTTPEANEIFTVSLSNATGATIYEPVGTGTILNDDGWPGITIDDVTKSEGLNGTVDFVFTITLDNAPLSPVTVDYSVLDGTATVGDNDYVAIPDGALTFDPGATTQTITVTVNGDNVSEYGETFTIHLANPNGATLTNADGIGTILDGADGTPGLSVDDVSMDEGDAGQTEFIFTVGLDAAITDPVTVRYYLIGGTATLADADYEPISGYLTFAPSTDPSEREISVFVNGDTKFEADETFTLVLANPIGGARINKPFGIGTILNDDGMPELTVTGASQLEGNTGTTQMPFTINLAGNTALPVTVAYTFANETATAGEDYTAVSGSVTFAPGETTKTIYATINGDTKYEADETFTLTLSDAVNGDILADQATGVIRNDDAAPTVTIGPASVAEGKTGTANLVYTVTLSKASGLPVSVNYATADGSALLTDSDYVQGTGTLNFAAGETTKTITVLVNGDTKIEGNETVLVNIANPAGATLGTAVQGIGTIINDDFPPVPKVSVYQYTTRSWAIANNQTKPISIGTIRQKAAAATAVFRIYNLGTATLKTGKLAIPKGYVLLDPLATYIAAGTYDSIVIQLPSRTPGTFAGKVTFATNVPGTTYFIFPITGTVTPLATKTKTAASAVAAPAVARRTPTSLFSVKSILSTILG